MKLMHLFVVVLLAFAVIGATGCGEEPAPIAPKADVPLSSLGADGDTVPAPPPAAPAAPTAPADTEEPEEDDN